jgi:hypothetical protein
MMGAASTAANKRETWDRAYYARKKLRVLNFDSTAVASAATTPYIANSTTTTNGLLINANVVAAADSW